MTEELKRLRKENETLKEANKTIVATNKILYNENKKLKQTIEPYINLCKDYNMTLNSLYKEFEKWFQKELEGDYFDY